MKKEKITPQKIERTARRLLAISNPMRIKIIELLEKNGKMNVTQIYTKLHIEQAAASHHLFILKNSGMIDYERDGKNMFYFLKPGAVDNLTECINHCSK